MSALASMLSVLAAEAAHSHPTWEDFGPVEWIAIVVAQAVAIWAIWKAVMYTVNPGEKEPDHIKRVIFLENDKAPGVALQAWLVEHHGEQASPGAGSKGAAR